MLCYSKYFNNKNLGVSYNDILLFVCCYAYLKGDSQQKIFTSLKRDGVEVTLYGVRKAYSLAPKWLGITNDPTPKGRPNKESRVRVLNLWREFNGAPTIDDMICGWRAISIAHLVDCCDESNGSGRDKFEASRAVQIQDLRSVVAIGKTVEGLSDDFHEDDFRVAPKNDQIVII
jgi:hypothetical protein